MNGAIQRGIAAGLLAGCISSSSPPAPARTTVVVPQGSGTTVICQNGNPAAV